MKEEYRREMEQLGPRPEELERLYTMIGGGTEMKKTKRLGSKAAAVLVCAVLTLTVTAAAAAPAVWEALQSRLGVFAPYAQTIEGAVCADQGIEVRVLSAISDDLEARVYLSVRDVEQDRLNEFLTLGGTLTAGEAKDPESVFSNGISVVGGPSTSVFDLVSYDPETKTALLSAGIRYLDTSRPTGEARLEVSDMTTRRGTMLGSVSCASVTGTELDSLPAGENDRVVFKPSDLYIDGGPYTDSVLPDEQVVLAPGQTPMPLEGTEDARISSMGFASDGRFHVRLEFAEGVAPELDEYSGFSRLTADMQESTEVQYFVFQERLVEGGVDILFPLLKVEDLKEVQSRQARFYGGYTRPGMDIEGSWSTEFELEYYSSTVLDWAGELDGWQVERVTVSPLSVTMNSNASGGLNIPLYAVKRDGSIVAAEAGTSSYSNLDAAAEINGELTGEPKGWKAYNTWKFEEPVEVEDIVSLKLGDAVIPVN